MTGVEAAPGRRDDMSQPMQSFPTHTLHGGDAPLVISVPHAGTALPPELAARLTPLALALPDTDWHVASCTTSPRRSASR